MLEIKLLQDHSQQLHKLQDEYDKLIIEFGNIKFRQLMLNEEETQLIKSALQKDISVDIKLDNMTLGKSVFRILDGALTNEVLKKAIPAGGTFLGGW